MFIPIIVVESLCQIAKKDVSNTTVKAITPLWDAGIFGSDLMTLELKEPEKKAVESLRAFHRSISTSTRLGNLLSTMSMLISWCKDFEGNIEQTAEQQKDFTDAAVIIHDRLVSLRTLAIVKTPSRTRLHLRSLNLLTFNITKWRED